MRYVVLFFVLLLGAGFVFINWGAVNTPVNVDLFFTKAEAPLGMMLLVWFAVMFCILAYGLIVQQASAMRTLSKVTKEMEAQRKLASTAESSRLNEVKSAFDQKWQSWLDEEKQALQASERRLNEGQTRILDAVKSTLEQVQQSNKELSEAINGSLDTMDDKITKVLISAKPAAETPRQISSV